MTALQARTYRIAVVRFIKSALARRQPAFLVNPIYTNAVFSVRTTYVYGLLNTANPCLVMYGTETPGAFPNTSAYSELLWSLSGLPALGAGVLRQPAAKLETGGSVLNRKKPKKLPSYLVIEYRQSNIGDDDGVREAEIWGTFIGPAVAAAA